MRDPQNNCREPTQIDPRTRSCAGSNLCPAALGHLAQKLVKKTSVGTQKVPRSRFDDTRLCIAIVFVYFFKNYVPCFLERRHQWTARRGPERE